MKKTVCVVGEGAWGTAVASLLADNGYHVRLWCHDKQVADGITATRENIRYAPNIKLSQQIEPFTDIAHALTDIEWVFCTTPIIFLRSLLLSAHAWYTPHQTWVLFSKGIEQKTVQLPTEILADVFGNSVQSAVVYGPSFAQDLMAKQTTGFVVAAAQYERAQHVATFLKNSYVMPFVSTDVMGAQLCAALKNVLAVGVGILDGAGHSDNTKAFLLTRGLQEMDTLVTSLSGSTKTVFGLAGVGDLVLSACGQLGRNVEIGRKIGRGARVQELSKNGALLPEGINTLYSVYALMQQQQIIMPVHQALYYVVVEGEPVSELIDALLID